MRAVLAFLLGALAALTVNLGLTVMPLLHDAARLQKQRDEARKTLAEVETKAMEDVTQLLKLLGEVTARCDTETQFVRRSL